MSPASASSSPAPSRISAPSMLSESEASASPASPSFSALSSPSLFGVVVLGFVVLRIGLLVGESERSQQLAHRLRVGPLVVHAARELDEVRADDALELRAPVLQRLHRRRRRKLAEHRLACEQPEHLGQRRLLRIAEAIEVQRRDPRFERGVEIDGDSGHRLRAEHLAARLLQRIEHLSGLCAARHVPGVEAPRHGGAASEPPSRPGRGRARPADTAGTGSGRSTRTVFPAAAPGFSDTNSTSISSVRPIARATAAVARRSSSRVSFVRLAPCFRSVAIVYAACPARDAPRSSQGRSPAVAWRQPGRPSQRMLAVLRAFRSGSR